MNKPAIRAPVACTALDRVIHEKSRLGIMTTLIAHPNGLAFTDLKHLCDLTDGNLSRHLQVLQEASLVKVIKSHRHNRPITLCELTNNGRTQLAQYLDVLERIVSDANAAKQGATKRRTPRKPG